ncbi:MAG: response regulator transcription factor [Alphaproteobacteria bacterium]|nr:response regulator transcription factor [Alphaproteobacteria bacterium]
MSIRPNVGAVRMLLGEPNSNLRHTLRQAFFREGFRGIDDCASAEHVREFLANRLFDIVVLDADMDGSETLNTISLLREKKLGKDPFSNIILISDPPQADRANQLINSGADLVLIRPVSVQLILERINHLIDNRHPFVVTHAYIGPERRTGMRAESMVIPKVDVPNNLKSRAYGVVDDNLYLSTVGVVWGIIERQRVERLIYQVGWLSKHLLCENEKDAKPTNLKYVAQIETVLKSLKEWMNGTAHERIFDASHALMTKAHDFLNLDAEDSADRVLEIRSDARALEGMWAKLTPDS